MAMIATSERTALATINRTLRIGMSTDMARGTSGDARPTRGPGSRPNPTYTSTGRPSVPITPSGSRRKILISSQVSFQSPRSMVSAEVISVSLPSVANLMAGELKKHILECRKLGAEVDDADPVLAQTVDHVRHQVVAAAANRHPRSLAAHRVHLRHRLEPIASLGVLGDNDDASFGAMTAHQRGRRSDIDDAAVVDDCDTVAQALGLLHQMRGQKHRLAAIADAAHEIPDRAARLRVEAGRQLVEEHHFGVVDQRERDEQALFLPAGQRHEPGVPLVAETKLLDEPVAVDRLAIERRPEADRFPDLDALLQLRRLQLDADPFLQLVHVPFRMKAQH